MDTHKPVAELTNHELIAEYHCIECDSVGDDARSEALIAEMARREIDF